MYRQFNLTKKLKHQLGSAISIILSVAMLVTALPMELLGIGSVEAAEALQPGSVGDMKWVFMAETAEEAVVIEGSTGIYKGLEIDATAGKLSVRNQQWAQFNTGAIIKVPVDGPCEITVNNYDTQYKVNGEAATEKTQTFTYEGSAGYVPVESTGSSYIDSIELKHLEIPDGTQDGLDKPGSVGDKKWVFMAETAEEAVVIEGSTGIYKGLEIDATAGKLAVRDEKWAQFNTGAIIKVPVDGPCEITVSAYDTQYKVNGEAATAKEQTFTYEGEAGYVPVESTGNSYIDFIELKHLGDQGTQDGVDKPGSVGDKKWVFMAETAEEAVVIEGTTGIYKGLEIDATAGKLAVRDEKWAQFNTGAIIKVPVDGPCEITVNHYDTKYKVNGEAATAQTQTFTYEGEAGYVPVEATGDSYIDSIEIKHLIDYIAEGTYLFGNMPEETARSIKGLTLEGSFADFANKHGFKANDGASALWLELSGQATITVTTCVYGNGDLKSSSGEVTTGTVKEESGTGKEFTVNAATGKTKLTLGAGAYVHSMSVTYDYVGERPVLDSKTPDVWDFGAAAVEGANNILTADVINGFYPNVTAGSKEVNIPAFVSRDINNVPAVKLVTDKTGNRLRTANTKLTRYDEASLTDKDGNVYEGHLYSNYDSSEATRLDIYLYEGDTLKCMLGSNEKPATYNLYAPNGEICGTFNYTAQNEVEEAVFHAAEDGWYKLICMDEKLVCARITREHAPVAAVSGAIDITKAQDIPANYGIIFTNMTTGQATEMTVENNAYSGKLYGGYTYQASLKGADGYVVKEGRFLELAKVESAEHKLGLEKVVQRVITGKITGLPADQLEKVELTFTVPEGYVFKPVFVLDRATGEYTLNVESGATYAVTADLVNDYDLQTTEISATEDKTADIEFKKKPVYEVTLNITGVEDASKASATFTNIDEEGYVYSFTMSEKMELRDGRYSVVVTGLGNYPVAQGLTPNVNVKGAPVTSTVPFHEISNWDFGVLNETVDFMTLDDKTYYVGLALSGAVAKNKSYLLIKPEASITIPDLKKDDKVTVKYCYEAAFKLGDVTVDEKSGSTAQIDSVEYTVKEDGNVVLEGITGTNAGQGFLCSIEVLKASAVLPYAATLSVGQDKTYKTIGDALADVRKMNRTADQKVTIMIDPGNYEEMLVVDTPNVTLKNASETPSIELKKKGVEIDKNAVRITWYYGHGYTYYSMGSDYKYNAEVLEVNKSNGYASCTNPGAGSGTYWNSTVVIAADNFNAEGIIFENSFNQYVSAKSLEDVIVAQSGAKEGTAKRAEMTTFGDTKVQEKDYVERAAALAITNNIKEVYFKNCKFVSRQDTLYGGSNVTAGFEYCSIYGGTDYIFGGMTAVFKQCDLVFNTNDQTVKGLKDDVGYITAPQQTAGRGYLMYKCTVTSTTPGVDTASKHTSKPGYFGRPWQGVTGEAVFYKTTIEKTDRFWNTGDYKLGDSLICAEGWNSSLGGESALCGEYGTIEESGVDNSANRVGWAQVFKEEKLADGTPISIQGFLGAWAAPFGPDDEKPNPPKPSMPEGLYIDVLEDEFEYTGSAIKPAIEVYNNGELLTAGIDYTVKYSNNVKACTDKTAKNAPKITVTGKGNLTGGTSTTFVIRPKDISEVSIGKIIVAKGSKATPVLVYNGMKLGTKDYTFDPATDAKKKFTEDGTITLKGKGNFGGMVVLDVKVVDKTNLKKFTVEVGKEVLTYNGEEQVPTITVKDSKTKAVLDETQYFVVYSTNKVSAGTHKFTVIGMGEYSGTVAKSYKIKPVVSKETSAFTVEGVDPDGYTFDRAGVTLDDDLEVYYSADKVLLTAGRDYKVTYSNNKKVSTDKSKAKYKITFLGDYKGSKALSGTFTINPAPLNNQTEGLKIGVANKVFNKAGIYKSAPIVTIDGVALKGSDYKVEYYLDQEMKTPMDSKNKVMQAGAKVYVKITGKGNYAPADAGSFATEEYEVCAKSESQRDMSKVKVTFVDAAGNKLTKVPFTGEEVEPAVKVEFKNGKTWEVVPADQYKLTYVNNVNKGKATVIVTAKNKQDNLYVGSKTVKFSIVAQSIKNRTDIWSNIANLLGL